MTVPLADRFRRAFGAETAIGVVVLAFSGWLLALDAGQGRQFADEAYTREMPFVDPSTGIDAARLHRPGGGRPQRLPDRGQHAAGGDHRASSCASIPPSESGGQVIGRISRSAPPARSCSPTDKGCRSTVAGHVDDRAQRIRPRSARSRALEHLRGRPADGTGDDDARLDRRRPCRCKIRSSISRRRAPPFVTTDDDHDASRRPPRALTTDDLRRVAGLGQQLVEADWAGHLELLVAAPLRRAVGPPAHELHAVAEAAALELAERDLDDALDAERHERQVLVDVPAAESARHALLAVGLHLGPVLPRMVVERVRGERRQLGEQLAAGT